MEFPSPIIHSDPWKSNERTKLMLALIDGAANEHPEQKLEQEENIVVHLLTIDGTLSLQLQQLIKDHNYEIEAKLWTFATGLSLGSGLLQL